jgi:hypothetical protein
MKPRRPIGIIRPLAPILGCGRRRWRGGPLVPMIWRRRLRARPAPQRPPAVRPVQVTQINRLTLNFIRPERTAPRPLPRTRIDHVNLAFVRPARTTDRPLAPIHHFNLTLVWPERTAARLAPLSRLERAVLQFQGAGAGEGIGRPEAGRLMTLIEHMWLRSAAADAGKPADASAFARSAGAERPGSGSLAVQGEKGAKRRFSPRAEIRPMRRTAADAGPARDERAGAVEDGPAPRFVPQAESMPTIAARPTRHRRNGSAAFLDGGAAPLLWRRANVSAMRAGAPAPTRHAVPGPGNAATPGKVPGGAPSPVPAARVAIRFGFLVWKDEGTRSPKSEAAPGAARAARKLPPWVTSDAAGAAPAPRGSGKAPPESGAASVRRGARAGDESVRESRGTAERLWKAPATAPTSGEAPLPHSPAARKAAPDASAVRDISGMAPAPRRALPGAREDIAPARRSRSRAALVWRGEGQGSDGIAARPSYPRARPAPAAEMVWRRPAPGSAPDESGIFGAAAAAAAWPGETPRADRPSLPAAPAPAAPAASTGSAATNACGGGSEHGRAAARQGLDRGPGRLQGGQRPARHVQPDRI